MIQADYLEYFKALAERKMSAERWSVWWGAHGSEMAELVPRSIYLRLTSPLPHQKISAVLAALNAAKVSYILPKTFKIHPKFYELQPCNSPRRIWREAIRV